MTIDRHRVCFQLHLLLIPHQTRYHLPVEQHPSAKPPPFLITYPWTSSHSSVFFWRIALGLRHCCRRFVLVRSPPPFSYCHKKTSRRLRPQKKF
jgi:hypothetical protein